jgi:hypothetical protein
LVLASPTQTEHAAPAIAGDHAPSPITAIFDTDELAFELGLWLGGLESFVSGGDVVFADKESVRSGVRDCTREARITHAALLLSSKLNLRLRRGLDGLPVDGESMATHELDDLGLLIRDCLMLNESHIRSAPLSATEWTSWSACLRERLNSSPAFRKLVDKTAQLNKSELPEPIAELRAKHPELLGDDSELLLIFLRFSKILRCLSVVRRIMQADEPLKPSLLIFSLVERQARDLVLFLENRLARLSNEDDEFFRLLDTAAYTASLELKKVYTQELTGLVDIRPTPSVRAKVETAYSLLADSFQQIVAGMAKLVEPSVTAFELFPNFNVKRLRSVVLRDTLTRVLEYVRAAEARPDKDPIQKAKSELKAFLHQPINHLYYKDREVFERFCEEIFAAEEKKDLVPILHRFGAYVETLAGQVAMRSVLAEDASV